MLLLPSDLKVWLYGQPTDMRKSFNGLSALVKQQLGEDPLSGQLFVFINRKKTHLKALYFDGSGFCLWCKRLEQGYFHTPGYTQDKNPLSAADLVLILEGINTQTVKRYKRYHHHRKSEQSSSTVLPHDDNRTASC
ncbi:IS66 family insertion sequence element accessory protein TnpB [Parendozoicomonas sp. Alg238-R29]|uniref:IS66 family insertion sequence element accessory protein TnpB n=1 Tax=Parendozoicomonas sp. Alg238-R29 TaxID=2993446 RepID=UPI00248DFF16|nr:IS66 family insertion sequence element accessory protein TnpB [Parendozoicomonas sp. Alg238-R29]